MSRDARTLFLGDKPWPYCLALTADLAQWANDRGLAERVVDLVYGVADLLEDDAARTPFSPAPLVRARRTE